MNFIGGKKFFWAFGAREGLLIIFSFKGFPEDGTQLAVRSLSYFESIEINALVYLNPSKPAVCSLLAGSDAITLIKLITKKLSAVGVVVEEVGMLRMSSLSILGKLLSL